MKISELIEQLQSLQENHWDIQVTVQYRDSWWCYYWQDEDCTPWYKDWKIIL